MEIKKAVAEESEFLSDGFVIIAQNQDLSANASNAMASGGGQNEYIWIKWTK